MAVDGEGSNPSALDPDSNGLTITPLCHTA